MSGQQPQLVAPGEGRAEWEAEVTLGPPMGSGEKRA